MYYFHLKYAKNGINRLMYGLIYKYALYISKHDAFILSYMLILYLNQ